MSAQELLQKLKSEISSYSFNDADRLEEFPNASNGWISIISGILEALVNEEFEAASAALEEELNEVIAAADAELAEQEAEQAEQAQAISKEELIEILNLAIQDGVTDYRREADLTKVFGSVYEYQEAAEFNIPGLKNWISVWITPATSYEDKLKACIELSKSEALSIAPAFEQFIKMLSTEEKLSNSDVRKAFAASAELLKSEEPTPETQPEPLTPVSRTLRKNFD